MQANVNGVCSPSCDPMEMLIGRIVEHEGIRRSAYQDSTGYWTIGIGRLIDIRKHAGLSVDECFMLLRNDLAEKKSELIKFEWFTKQDYVRQGALLEMAFNIGTDRLLGFRHMIDALGINNYSKASKELLSSLWALEVGRERTQDICYRLLSGRYK